VTSRLLHLPRFGGQSARAPGASLEEVEGTVRQRLYPRELGSSRLLPPGAGERGAATGEASGAPTTRRPAGRLAAWGWTATPGAVSRAGVQLGRHAPGALAIERRVAGDTLEFVLSGELDLATRDLLHEALGEIGETAPPRLVLDMSGLTFIDASGLHVLLSLAQRCRRVGPALELVPGPPSVHEAFEFTGLADRLPFTGPVASPPLSPAPEVGSRSASGRRSLRPSSAPQLDRATGPAPDAA
jgi:stage II sporulation protein AA (anti-sigma F factor antagonist)